MSYRRKKYHIKQQGSCFQVVFKQSLLLLILLLAINAHAQVPQGINYQAIVRDGDGNPLPSGTTPIRFIVSNSVDTYRETHAAAPINEYGLVNIVIGTGTPDLGNSFTAFDWTAASTTVEVIVDGVSMGAQSLQSVPYALHCATAESVVGGGLWTENGVNIYYAAGNVGVGTNSPNAPLEVNGNAIIGQTGEKAVIGNVGVNDAAGFAYLGYESAEALAFLQNDLGGTTINSFDKNVPAQINFQNNGVTVANLTHEGDASAVHNGTLYLKGVVNNRNQPAGKIIFEHTLSGTPRLSAEIVGGSGSGSQEGELRFNVLNGGTLQEALYIDDATDITIPSLAGGGLVSADVNGKLGISTTIGSWTKNASNIYYTGGNVGIGLNSGMTGVLHVVKTDVTSSSVANFVNNSASAFTRVGIQSTINSSTSTSSSIGISSYVDNESSISSRTTTGVQNTVFGGAGESFGVDLQLSGGSGSSSNIYGYTANVFNTTTGNKYAYHADFSGSASGTKYGVYTIGEDRNYFSGNVGIGTNTPSSTLHLETSNTTPFTIDMTLNGSYISSTGYNRLRLENGTSTNHWLLSTHAQIGSETTNNANFNIYYSGLGNVASFRGDGAVGIGVDVPTTGTRFQVQNANSTGYVARFYNYNTNAASDGIVVGIGGATPSTGAYYILFTHNAATNIPSGSISANGTGGLSFNATSDRRLKQNITNLENALSIVAKMQPRTYEFKANTSILSDGFIAQELQEVYPLVVTGDPNSDVKTEPMMIDYSKLTPLLTKAIQEQQLLIEGNKKQIQLLQEELNALKRQ